MTEEGFDGQDRRRDPRVPLEARVDVKFESLSSFISTHSKNISRGGMFLAIDDPAPVGTPLGFDLKLADGLSLVRGRGEVVWASAAVEESDATPGMAVKFLTLDDQSWALVDKIVDDVMASGSEPFLLSRFLEEAGVAAAADAPPVQASMPFSDDDEKTDQEEPPPSMPADWDAVQGAGPGVGEGVEVGDLPTALPESSGDASSSSTKWVWLVATLLVIAVGVVAVWKVVLPRLGRGSAEIEPPAQEQVAGPEEIPSVEPVVSEAEPALAEPATEEVAESQLDTEIDHVAVDLVLEEQGPTEPKADLGLRATAVDSISWSETSSGDLLVTVACNGRVGERSLRSEPLIDPPRHVFRLRGIEEPYPFPQLTPGHPFLSAIRLGHHGEKNPPELHIVLDLAGEGVVVSDVQVENNQVILLVGR